MKLLPLRKSLFLLPMLFLVGLLPSPAAAAAAGEAQPNAVKLLPSKIFVDAERGERQTVNLTAVSTFKIPVVIDKIDTWDFAIDDEGNPKPIPAKDAERFYGASRWVTYPKDKLTIGPGQQVKVPVTIKVPGKTQSGTHYTYIRTSIVPKQKKTGAMRMMLKVSSMLLVTVDRKGAPARLKRRLRISSFTVPKLAWRPFTISNTIENKGNIHETLKGKIEIFSGKRKVDTVSLGEHTVLPETKLRWDGAFRSLPLVGTYKVVSTFTGGSKLLRAEKTMTVISPGLILLVAALLILVVWGFWFYRRFKKNYKIVKKEILGDLK